MKKLWHVEIHEDDWDYDNLESAIVWAETEEEADRLVRALEWEPTPGVEKPRSMFASPETVRLVVTPAKTEGVVHTFVHYG